MRSFSVPAELTRAQSPPLACSPPRRSPSPPRRSNRNSRAHTPPRRGNRNSRTHSHCRSNRNSRAYIPPRRSNLNSRAHSPRCSPSPPRPLAQRELMVEEIIKDLYTATRLGS